MPRYARSMSNTGIYHVMLRGNERKQIFVDDEDKQRFVDTLQYKCQKEYAVLYAYCLMDNHVHLLIGVINNKLDVLMKRISVSYVYYFNRKYKRIGHLFQDRFKSESVESEQYLLEALRYILNNPVKAGMVKSPFEYKWSSSYEYIKKNSIVSDTTKKILDLFSADTEKAKKLFADFCNREGEIEFTDYDSNTLEEKRIVQEEEAFIWYMGIISARGIQSNDLLLKQNQMLRDHIIRQMKASYNLSIRQISKVLGIGRGVVQKVLSSNV